MSATAVGITRLQRVVPVASTTAYSDGDAIGGLLTFTDFIVERNTGLITRIGIQSSVNFGPLILHLFNTNPTTSTFTDNAALAISAADKPKRFRSVYFAATEVTDAGVGGFEACKYVTEPFEFLSGTGIHNLYAALEATGSLSLASTTDMAVWVGAELN